MPPKRRVEHGMTPGEKAFAIEWLSNGRIGLDAWQTTHPGCSKNTAVVNASKTLSKANIQAYILELEEQQFKELGISPKKTMAAISRIAYRMSAVDEKSFDKKLKMIGTHVVTSLRDLAKIQKLFEPDVVVNLENTEYTGPIIMMPTKKSVR
jgi:hypothetical protein